VTPLYPQKLALTSPTGGGRSVGIVCSRTKAMEFSLVLVFKFLDNIREDKEFRTNGSGLLWIQSVLNFFMNEILIRYLVPNI
jgi:hypothetical protein